MKKIPLTKGQFAIVDDWWYDYLMQWKWNAHFDPKMNGYYAVRTDYSSGKKLVSMHREINRTPKNMLCDHVDHATLNNQEYNLRNCSCSENQWNAKIRVDNTSGFKGVNWHKGKKKWVARVYKDGRYVFVKSFSTAVDAAIAYDKVAKELYGNFAKLNFPEESHA